METCDLSEESKKKLKTVQISNNTHNTQDLSADTEEQLVSQIISSFACFVETWWINWHVTASSITCIVHYLFKDRTEGRFNVWLCSSQTPSVSHILSVQSWVFKVCGNNLNEVHTGCCTRHENSVVYNHSQGTKGVICGPKGAQLADKCVLIKLTECHSFLPSPIHARPCHGPWATPQTAKTCRGAQRVPDTLVRTGHLRETTLTEKHWPSRIAGGWV